MKIYGCRPDWRCTRYGCPRCDAKRREDAQFAERLRQLKKVIRERTTKQPDDPSVN